MARRVSGKSLALEDQLAAILRDKGPQTTGQLARSMPWQTYTWSVGHCRSCSCKDVEKRSIETPVKAEDIRPTLKRMERAGKVLRLDPPMLNNHGGYVWLPINEADFNLDETPM